MWLLHRVPGMRVCLLPVSAYPPNNMEASSSMCSPQVRGYIHALQLFVLIPRPVMRSGGSLLVKELQEQNARRVYPS